jgi:hypothetical protein
MNQKTTLLVLALTLAITAALAITPIVNEMAYAKVGISVGPYDTVKQQQQQQVCSGISNCPSS